MNDKKPIFRQGYIVGAALFVLTVVEYYVGVAIPSATLLFLMAAVKGALVVYYFMHIANLWSHEEGH